MRIALRSLAVMLAFVAVFGSAQPQKKPSLTNQDIVRMVKDKFSDSTIVKAIEANRTTFDVSATALIALKDSGVSQTVIEAMLAASTPKGANAAGQTAAKSAASAPPPPAQSQAQSTPPCSDVPVLKRGDSRLCLPVLTRPPRRRRPRPLRTPYPRVRRVPPNP